MAEYLDDPSVLTKDKLKSELLAHNVELPSGNPTKDVYVQLYLKSLTARNQKQVPATSMDAFSSDEELPPSVVSSRSRSSGRKATRKTDNVHPGELDVTALCDDGLRAELLKQGMNVGPVLASTRKLYEKKLQKLLDEGPSVQQLLPTNIQVNHNVNSESEIYSDIEHEVTPEPEAVTEPEPVVVERPTRSRGKTPTSTCTQNSKLQTVEKISASEQPVRMEEKEVQKEVYPTDITSPTGMIASCRRPIRGAAGRPVISSNIWKDENGLFSPKSTNYYSESHVVNRVSSSASISSPRLLTTSQTKPARGGVALWIKLSLLGVVVGLLVLVYQAMETTSTSPFVGQYSGKAASSV